MSVVADYEDLIQLLRDYDTYAARFAGRALRSFTPLTGVLKGVQRRRSPYSRPPALLAVYERMATDTDRAHPLFGVLTARSSADALAERFVLEHPAFSTSDVKALSELHRLHTAQHAAASPRRTLAVVLSLAAIVGQTVPKEAFEYLNWDGYNAFAFFVTLFTIATALYVLLLVGLMARATRSSAPERGAELVLVVIEANLARGRHAKDAAPL